jgi:hypothetical protein
MVNVAGTLMNIGVSSFGRVSLPHPNVRGSTGLRRPMRLARAWSSVSDLIDAPPSQHVPLAMIECRCSLLHRVNGD